MKLKLGKIYKQVDEEGYCYFTKYTGEGAMSMVKGGFLLIGNNQIVQVVCEKNSNPVSVIDDKDFSEGNFDGDTAGAGSLEDIEQLFKHNYLEEMK
ncbi:hypothetical protein [Liquorilactobacillus nagelii]|jgi:hypothetical protein|uniref:hypothetical protein n=1 Tax=Liquorilactobacillus nagelii TaxID=82688 RepID=UPI0006F00D35|nr:hypothetical protein [Liquorilactobacillus nagelii]KRL40715.1 hypothetical protein FD45_GL001358 [Liquorilactobacillus nagelii DSM 13675]QYH53675.1 hypothetical protein G6O73_02750 [Liquorilactobacillus nagelii DSM 13675]